MNSHDLPPLGWTEPGPVSLGPGLLGWSNEVPTPPAPGETGDTHHGGQVHVLHPLVLQQHGLQAGHSELHGGRAVDKAQKPVPTVGREDGVRRGGRQPQEGPASPRGSLVGRELLWETRAPLHWCIMVGAAATSISGALPRAWQLQGGCFVSCWAPRVENSAGLVGNRRISVE